MDKQKDNIEIVIGEGEVRYSPPYKKYYIKWNDNEIDIELDAFLSDEYKDLKHKGKKVKLIISEE